MKQTPYRIAVLFVICSVFISQFSPVLAQSGGTETPPVTVTETQPVETTPTVAPSETPTAEGTAISTSVSETATAVETPSPTATETISETPTVLPTETTEVVSVLTLSTDPAYLTESRIVNLSWSLEGISLGSKPLVVQISLPKGFEPSKKDKNYDKTARIFNIPVTALQGSVELQAKKIKTDSIFNANLLSGTELITGASLILPLFEQFDMSARGGEIDTLKGKVKVTFPDGALPEDAFIAAGFPSDDALPANFTSHVFELRAHGKRGNNEISHFQKSLAIDVDYSDLNLTPEQEAELYLYWYNPKTGDWNALPSTRDAATKKLHATTDHFTVFDIGVNNWRSTRLPTIDSFQVSEFTGAATYNLPIEVPEGPGGFKPSVNLSYNSQVVDQATFKAQASWVGMGWSLDGGGSITDNGDGTGYMLNVNGVSTQLVRETATGEYHTMEENFWRVAYTPTTGGFIDDSSWTIYDTSGNKYVFNERATYPGWNGQDYIQQAYAWYLSSMTNVYGQVMSYNYIFDVKKVNGIWTQTAAYINSITYPNDRYRITFARSARTDYPNAWDTDAAFHEYERFKLAYILVREDADGDGTWTAIRDYQFNYATDTDSDRIWPTRGQGNGGSPLTLRSVIEHGMNGSSALPATTFYYDRLHLTSAANGYGGSVSYTYDPQPYYETTNVPASDIKTSAPCTILNDDGATFKITPWVVIGGTGGTGGTVNCTSAGTLKVVAGSVRTNYYTVGTDFNLVRPGGVYQVDFTGSKTSGTVQTGVRYRSQLTTVQASANSFSYTVVGLDKSASTVEAFFQASNTAQFTNLSIKLLPSYYRVVNKIVSDGTNSYITKYEPFSPKTGSADYEFRGHRHVKVTAPDGTYTDTYYYQDDARKGRVDSSCTFTSGGVKISCVDNDYQVTNLPEYPISNKYQHALVYLNSEAHEIYDANGVLIGGTQTFYAYDEYGNMITKAEYPSIHTIGFLGIKGGSGVSAYRVTTITYNPKNTATLFIASAPAREIVTDANGGVLTDTEYYYNGSTCQACAPTANIVTMMRSKVNGSQYAQTDFTYDTYGNQISKKVYTTYGGAGLAPAATDAQTTSTAYDGIYHTYPISVTNALGQPITLTYDYTLGVPLTETDPNGAVTKADYDSFGRIIGLHKPDPVSGAYEANASLTMAYTDNPFTTTITQVDTGYLVIKTYDGLGRETQTNAGGIITDTIYDSATVTRQSTPHISGEPASYTKTETFPDTHSTVVTAPDGTSTTTVTNGLTTINTDARGNSTTSFNDIWGRTTKVTPPIGPVIDYTYDEMDRLLTATRGGVTTTLAYNNAGQKVTMSDPDMGNWSYTYYPSGNLNTQTDARGCLLTMGYDILNRLTSKGSSGTGCGTPVSTTYTYDAGTNGVGRRTSMNDASGSTSWLYDKRGRVTSETKVVSGQTYLTGFSYNNADMPFTMTYPDNEMVKYGYNSQMQLNNVTSPSWSYASSILYDSAGRMTHLIRGDNLLDTTYNYNPWTTQGGRLQNLTTGSLQNINYQYDAAGNISQITNNLASETSNYSYDALDRLTSWTLNNGTPETYNYDPNTGNLQSKAGVGYTAYDQNHAHAVKNLSNGNSYTYDSNGNQTTRVVSGQTFTLGYDAENRLVSVSGAGVNTTFTYDGDGARVKAVENGVTTLFVGSHYEVKNPGSGQEVTKYYLAGATRIAMRKYTIPQSMSVEYMLGDHLGSTSITTDTTGAKVSEMRYTPWGEVRYSWTAAQTTTPAYKLSSYTFTGQYSYMDDPSTSGVTEGFGLMFYNARMYDPALGRFTSADSIVPAGVQGYDRYAYVSNNPVRYTDPTGHKVACDPIEDDCHSAPSPGPTPTPKNPKPHEDDLDQNPNGIVIPSTVCTSSLCIPNIHAEAQAQVCSYSMCNPQWGAFWGNAYTPVLFAAIQLFGAAIQLWGDIAFGIGVGSANPLTLEGGALMSGIGYGISKVGAVGGLYATTHQYYNNLNGTNGTDMHVAVDSTVLGLPAGINPVANFALSAGNLVYTIFRASGVYEPPDSQFPQFP